MTTPDQYVLMLAGEDALRLQGDFTWEESAAPSLTGLDASVKTGDLLVIVGQTGELVWAYMFSCGIGNHAVHALLNQTALTMHWRLADVGQTGAFGMHTSCGV